MGKRKSTVDGKKKAGQLTASFVAHSALYERHAARLIFSYEENVLSEVRQTR
jgi:hypothetical protein